MASKPLLKALTTPCRVASLLENSRGARPLLALEIQRHRIGMAMIWSPMGGDNDVELLPDITLVSDSLIDKKGRSTTNTSRGNSRTASLPRRIPESCLRELTSTIRSHDVCALIVGWPVQPNMGKMGGPCGRVLYTLESILGSDRGSAASRFTSTPLLSPHRPICFWTRRSVLDSVSTTEDEWGRCPAYGKPSLSKTMHLASVEQYAFDETAQATDLWEDFWKTHWHELYNRSKQKKRQATKSAGRTFGNNLVADWRETPSYLAGHVAI